MPVAHFHLVDGAYSAEQRRRLLADASRCYAEVLDSPIERVRAFVVRYDPGDAATTGTVIADGGTPAPTSPRSSSPDDRSSSARSWRRVSPI